MDRMKYLDKSYEKDEYVKRWLTGLAERSKVNYLREIHEWLSFVDLTPTEQIKKRMHDLTTEDLTERLFFENKFREFKEYLEKKGTLRPDSVKTMLRTVASFFSRNGLPLNLKSGDWKTTSEERAVKRWTPTNEEIKRMYGHANLRDRALLLALYQSGFSEVDVSALRIEDLKGLYENPENEHYFIEKKREKSGETQATCLSYECVHDLKSMLSERANPQKGFLFVSTTKGKGDRLEVRSINEAMKDLAVKTFGSEKAKEFKTKSLRSAYNSALLRANIQPQELKDLLFGHARGSARGHYAYDEITVKEAYLKAFEYLTVNGIQARQDISKLKEELKQDRETFSKTIAEQQTKIEGLEKKLESLATDLIRGLHEVAEKKGVPHDYEEEKDQ
jgi:site-specific recombinase XerC